ncbi:MAG: hypothetical protein GY757_31765 [bacterium]|nr:hypothetical protein [bacterium]
MSYNRKNILHAITNLQGAAEEIDSKRCISFRKIIETKFARYRFTGALWSRLKHSVGICAENGWIKISEWIGNRPNILFFDSFEDESMFLFKNGGYLKDVLGECVGFEFYVSNENATFLLSHNHHDYLLASGEAFEWLSQFPDARIASFSP